MNLKLIRDTIIFAILRSIIYIYAVVAFFYFADIPEPNGLVIFLCIAVPFICVIDYLLYISPYKDYKSNLFGISVTAAWLKTGRASRKRPKVAQKFVKYIYKNEISPEYKKSHTHVKFRPCRLTEEIDDIPFIDVADLVEQNLRELGYDVNVKTYSIDELKSKYGDVYGNGWFEDPDLVRELSITHAEWTISWDKTSKEKKL